MRNKTALTDILLLSLEKSVDGYVRFEDFMDNPHIYANGYERPLKKNNLSQSLRRLRLKGYVNLEKFNDQLVYKLSTLGKNEAVFKKILINDEWDGKWRLVIFDIPEENRKARNVLRARLKLWRFEPWQKSVWATKKNLSAPIRDFVQEAGLEKWVMVIEAGDVGNLQTSVDRQ